MVLGDALWTRVLEVRLVLILLVDLLRFIERVMVLILLLLEATRISMHGAPRLSIVLLQASVDLLLVRAMAILA